MVVFEKCDPEKRTTCKSEEEITAWLEFKYIILLENSKQFVSHLFETDRIAESGWIRWFPVSNQARTDYVKIINRSELNLNDYRVNIGSLIQDIDSGFEPVNGINRLLPYKNRFWNAITYEMSLTQFSY